MSNESSYKSGQSDANKGYGPKPGNSFSNYVDRQGYNAGYNGTKK